MAGNWDRDEDRGGSNQWRSGEGRERSSSIFGDDDRERSRGASGGGSRGGEERGFFQRVGEQVRSWVGDDDGPSGPGRSDRYDRSEPWGGGDWAGSDEAGRGRSSGGGYRSRPQSWSEGNDAGGRRGGEGQSHYGSEHGFGGFQGDYRGGDGQGGFGGEGDYRGGRQNFSAGSQERGGRTGFHHDDHYLSWRARQIEQMDRDYEDYCRDRQQSFHTDFASWRQNRQSGGGSGAGASASTGSSGTTGFLTGSGETTGGGDEGLGETGSTASPTESEGAADSKAVTRSKRTTG